MNYQLFFFDEAQRVQDVWDADFGSEHTAICWMWIAGGVWAKHSAWSAMELRCRRCVPGRVPCPRPAAGSGECCIARIPWVAVKRAAEMPGSRARPIILIAESDPASAACHEAVIRAAGCTTATFADCAAAKSWLDTNSPDAAVLDVRPKDGACTALALSLSQREIPFLAVSRWPAGAFEASQIFETSPWLNKPVSPAGLELVLRSFL